MVSLISLKRRVTSHFTNFLKEFFKRISKEFFKSFKLKKNFLNILNCYF